MNTANGSPVDHRVQDMGTKPPQIGGVLNKPRELKPLDRNTQLRPKLIPLNKPPIPMLTLRRLGFTTSRRRIITILSSSITIDTSTTPPTLHYQEMGVRPTITKNAPTLIMVRLQVLNKNIGNEPNAHRLNLFTVLQSNHHRLSDLCHHQC